MRTCFMALIWKLEDWIIWEIKWAKFKFESKVTPKILSLEEIRSVVQSRVTTERRLYFAKRRELPTNITLLLVGFSFSWLWKNQEFRAERQLDNLRKVRLESGWETPVKSDVISELVKKQVVLYNNATHGWCIKREEDWSQNGALRHAWVEWCKRRKEIVHFNELRTLREVRAKPRKSEIKNIEVSIQNIN